MAIDRFEVLRMSIELMIKEMKEKYKNSNASLATAVAEVRIAVYEDMLENMKQVDKIVAEEIEAENKDEQ